MVSCSACHCSEKPKTIEKGISFHRFPKDQLIFEKWVEFVNIPGWFPKKGSVLCSQHFPPDMFDRTGFRVKLVPGAVPSIEVSHLKYTRSEDLSRQGYPEIHEVQFESCIQRVYEANQPGTSSQPPLAISSESAYSSYVGMKTPNREEEHIDSASLEDTPKKKILKRHISSLRKQNASKNRKIKKLQQKLWRQRKIIQSLKSITKELKKKSLLLDEQENVLLENFGKNKTIVERLFNKTRGKSVPRRFEPELRSFAVSLHYFSPRAYNYVRNKFENSLPHTKTISRWYSSVDASPGFTTEAINFLHAKMRESDKPLVCSLILDEMSIRQQLEFVGSKYHGLVDFGANLTGDNLEIAQNAFVFLLVCLTERWKLPVGYFFVAGINGEQKATLVKHCLTLLQDTGVRICSITFDGCSANISMSRMLGCSLVRHSIKSDFIFNNQKYFMLLDPAHMMKLIRNSFGELERFIDLDGNIIDFRYVKKLNELQETEGLHLGNKLRRTHILFFKQKMKVRLATQLLSKSVATSLLFCKNVLHLSDFENCTATANFIAIINDAFDILNSRKLSTFGYKKAASSCSIDSIKHFFSTFEQYILNLRHENGQFVTESNRKTGFLGFLMGFKCLLGLYEEYCASNNILSYIPLYKCSQDHIEMFFGAVRARGGYNNNPSCRQFTAAYKRLLIHSEIRDGGAGNCMPLEDISILSISSAKKPPHEIINDSVIRTSLSSIRESDDATSEQFDNVYLEEHNYALNYRSLSDYSSEIVAYIAGFVAHKLLNRLKCEQCMSVLQGDRSDFLNSLISYKSQGGLTYPSEDVIKICITTEKYLRIEQLKNNLTIDKNIISMKVLNNFLSRSIFSSLEYHDSSPLESHKMLLIKSICHLYLNTRIHFICRTVSSNVDKIRTLYTKLIHFKGQ